MTPRGEKYPTGVLVAYYLILAAFFVASFYPQYRVWGISWWAYFPLWVKFGLLATGLVAPFVADRLMDRLLAGRDDITPKTYRWLVGGFAITMTALFYLLRARTHFLGDGYTLLSLMADENHLIKPREYGGTILQFGLYKLMGGGGQDVALFAYQIISITAGITFLAIAIFITSRLLARNLDRLAFLLLVCTGGYMLMFFGYVENYAFFLVSILAYSATALLVADGRAKPWWILVAQAIPICFHIFGVVLIPATLFLLIARSPVGKWVHSRSLSVKAVLATAFLITVAAVFLYFYFNILFLRLSILPIVYDRFTVDGYTMFSGRHLVDYLNLIIIVFPGIAIAIVTLLWQATAHKSWNAGAVTSLLMILGCFGAAFIFDPKLAMPRDWDLFAFIGISAAVSYYAHSSSASGTRTKSKVALLLIATNLIVLGPRAVALATPNLLAAHIESDAKLDPAKAGPTFFFLNKWLREHRQEAKAATIDSIWQKIDPEGAVIKGFASGNLKGDTTALVAVLESAIKRNPSNWNAWANLGVVRYRQTQYDSALVCLNRAKALNPYSSLIHFNLALCHWRKAAFAEAEQAAWESFDLDTNSIHPLTLLTNIYRDWGQEEKYIAILKRLAQRDDAPASYVLGLINYLWDRGRVDEAQKFFSESRALRVDSTELARLKEEAAKYSNIQSGVASVPKFEVDSDDTPYDSTIWDEAARLAVAKNPTSWVAWGNLGVVYLRKDAFDSARSVLEIAVAINPINSANFSNLAFAQFYLGDYVSAEASWVKAMALDSSSIFPLVGLAKLYQRTNQQEEYLRYFMQVVSRPDAPGDYLKVLGDYYLLQKRWKEAAETYARAVRNGYSARLLDSIYSQNPQLTGES